MSDRDRPVPNHRGLGYDHIVLRAKVVQHRIVEKTVLGIGNVHRDLSGDFPAIVLLPLEESQQRVRRVLGPVKRHIRSIVKGSPLDNWNAETRGLGIGMWLLLGSMPSLQDFANPSAVWKYVGLHVSEGQAVRKKAKEALGFAAFRRSYAIKRVADPIVKVGGPYRVVYDVRRERTVNTHPPMLNEDGEILHPECGNCRRAVEYSIRSREVKELKRERKAPALDCSAMGGRHWTDGHRHADALRVTAKAVLLDAWRVARGLTPRVGSDQATQDNH